MKDTKQQIVPELSNNNRYQIREYLLLRKTEEVSGGKKVISLPREVVEMSN